MKQILSSVLLLIGMAFNVYTSSAQAVAPCAGARKDISSFSTADKEELCNLIVEYLKSKQVVGATGVAKYSIVSEHNQHSKQVHFTGTVAFLTWHRYYLQELEKWLLEKGKTKFVPLPAWNPNVDMPDVFFDEVKGKLPTADGFAKLVKKKSTASFTPFLGTAKCSFTNIDDFSNELENVHGDVHGDVGGTMNFVAISPGAAIFWLWHAYVDDLWYCYQKECKKLTSDLYVRDEDTDDGTEPSTASVLWNSPDIWIRNNADGYANQVSESIYQTPGKIAYVYIRVWNRGKMPNENGVGKMQAYWAHGSTGLAWQAPWDGTTKCNGTLPLGGKIGEMTLRRVNEDFINFTHNNNVEKDYTIYEFSWAIPDPDKYKVCFGTGWEHRHFCILARMEDGNPMVETSDLYANIKNNNNIALKNITIFGDGLVTAVPPVTECLLFGNYGGSEMTDVHIRTTFPTAVDAELFNYADINIKFEDGIINNWKSRGEQGNDAIWQGGGNIIFNRPNAEIRGLTIHPNEIRQFCVSIVPKGDTDRRFEFDIVQTDGNRIINGERYVINGINRSAGSRNEKTGSNAIKSIERTFLMYPNPSGEDIVNLYWADKVNEKTIKVFDELGRELHSYSKVIGSFELSTTDLQNGIYFVQMTDVKTEAKDIQRLVVNKN